MHGDSHSVHQLIFQELKRTSVQRQPKDNKKD